MTTFQFVVSISLGIASLLFLVWVFFLLPKKYNKEKIRASVTKRAVPKESVHISETTNKESVSKNLEILEMSVQEMINMRFKENEKLNRRLRVLNRRKRVINERRKQNIDISKTSLLTLIIESAAQLAADLMSHPQSKSTKKNK